MKREKLDLETCMVEPVLRDRLFRVNPAELKRNFLPLGELDEADIADIREAICIMEWLNPVLIDCDNAIVAGQGIVEAAYQIGLDDIPALKLEELNEEERRLYFYMTHHFFKYTNLEQRVFRIDAQHILPFTASGRLALEIQAAAARMAAQ